MTWRVSTLRPPFLSSIGRKVRMATPLRVASAHLSLSFPPPFPASQMQVRKRNGSLEPADVNKIVRAVERCCAGLRNPSIRCASPAKPSAAYSTARPRSELDLLSIQTAASLIAEEPEYSQARRASAERFHRQGSRESGHHSFSQSVALRQAARPGFRRISPHSSATSPQAQRRDRRRALRPLRVFWRCAPSTIVTCCAIRRRAMCIETPQQFFLRVACGLSRTVHEAIEFYRLISAHEYMPSSPTLFNSGTRHAQMSSCYLLDSPADNLEAIYDKYKDVALLSKFAGGIGLAYHRVRSRGSLIRATNGHSKGIVPWLKTLDSSVAAVNQGGKRKGACCVYLEPWHADIEEFPRAPRQHRGQRPAHLQPESRKLDSRSIHEARRSRRALVALRSQNRAAVSRSCRRRIRSGLRRRPKTKNSLYAR